MDINAISEFATLILSNLKKNNFPTQSVAFQLEPLYESAHRKGIHFNKVRDFLKEQGIQSEIIGSKIIFSSVDQTKGALDPENFEKSMQDPDFLEKALSFLSQMDPSYLESLGNMIPDGNKGQVKEGFKKFLNMKPDQRQQILEMAKRLAPK